jgi:Holliday junction resolvase RusA-like endonuclease
MIRWEGEPEPGTRCTCTRRVMATLEETLACPGGVPVPARHRVYPRPVGEPVIKISVSGKSAPQGNHRTNKYGATYETSKSVGPWREAIRAETQREAAVPIPGPVMVTITFRMIRPKSHYRTGRNAHLVKDGAPRYPDGRPDVDKLARAILDGLTAGGAFCDDGQVVDLIASKRYAETAGADILVTEMAE